MRRNHFETKSGLTLTYYIIVICNYHNSERLLMICYKKYFRFIKCVEPILLEKEELVLQEFFLELTLYKKVNSSYSFKTSECQEIVLTFHHLSMRLYVLYIPSKID